MKHRLDDGQIEALTEVLRRLGESVG